MWNKAKGFLVVGEPIRINDVTYCGVNTDAWPIGTDFDSEIAANICEMSYLNLDFPMLVDFDSAVHYYQLCQCAGIKSRMLYYASFADCSVTNLPQFENPYQSICLGFDYAYPSGDYYSSVANDIISKNRHLPTCWQDSLNEFGLLPTENDLLQFANERDLVARKNESIGQGIVFEKGCFTIFRVFGVKYS